MADYNVTDARGRSKTYKGAPLPSEIPKERTNYERGLDTYQGILDQPGGIKGTLKRAVEAMKEKKRKKKEKK